MLEKNDRCLLLDSLRPPEGFTLDRAVGTTYSLDLHALLSVPVAFAFRDAMNDDGRIDPLATLEGLRRHADRVHLFCQADAIQVPRGQQRLFAYLEDTVIPVTPAESGVFHPKCWWLRFTHPDGTIRYRFLCLSRNLTFDRSWDSALVLDGVLEPNRVTEPDAQPLARFVQELPKLARIEVRAEAKQAVSRIAEELPRVRFEAPPKVDAIRFWPLGVAGMTAPQFLPARRPMIIVSPFISDDWLRTHASRRKKVYLVSREDQLQALSAQTRSLFDRQYTFLRDATPEEDVEQEAEEGHLLDGLHAKLFIMNDGWDARVWTGSANATDAAFRHNVEMLVELVGRKSALKIDTRAGHAGIEFGDLLQEWQPPADEVGDTDAVAERLQKDLWMARQKLVDSDLSLTAGDADAEDRYPLHIEGDWQDLPTAVVATLRPLGLEPGAARTVDGTTIDFGPVTLDALSAFVAVELTAREGEQAQHEHFVLRLPLQGAPADRGSRLLRSMLQNRGELMRLLLILLADNGVEALIHAEADSYSSMTGHWLPGGDDSPLLESLLRTLDRSPERLDQIKSLLDDLGKHEDVANLLPDGFEALWDAIWANRERAADHA